MFSFVFTLAALVSVVSAHFQLQYPPPRGAFVAANEPQYCGGYSTTTQNRTRFPLNGGFYTIHSGHPKFTFGIQLANTVNPTSYENYTTAVNYFQVDTAGDFCFPVNLSASNVTGLQDGANVTLQFVYDGGDGYLYQCADVTLVQDLQIASNVSCANNTATGHSSSSSGGSAPSPTASSPSSAVHLKPGMMALLSVLAVALAFL